MAAKLPEDPSKPNRNNTAMGILMSNVLNRIYTLSALTRHAAGSP